MPQIVIPRPMPPALTTPLELPNLAAWYSLQGPAGDSTYIKDGSNRVTLIADRSGNSATSGLVLTGTSGNYASTPDSAAISITGDIDVQVFASADSWAPSFTPAAISHYNGSQAFVFGLNTDGTVRFLWVDSGGTTFDRKSTVAIGLAAFSSIWFRATLDVDNGAGGWDLKFYTSADGASWAQLGATVTVATPTSIRDATVPLEVGSINAGTGLNWKGAIYRARIYNGIGGILVFDANFAAQAKLSGSFTESSSNAATVTINSSGDLGARISGARDLYQGTTAKMPILSVDSSGFDRATFDGSNDYLRSAPFSLAQPEAIAAALSVTTWTSGRYVFDGANGANTAGLVMTTSSPQLNLNAGASAAGNTNLAVGTRGALDAVFNGASSALAINRTTVTTGDASTGTPNGITLFANGAATAASFGNGTFSEMVVRSAADDATARARAINYEAPKWGVTL